MLPRGSGFTLAFLRCRSFLTTRMIFLTVLYVSVGSCFEGTVKIEILAKAAKKNPCFGPEKEKIFSIAQILPGNANDF
jgi:hypothetical protein